MSYRYREGTTTMPKSIEQKLKALETLPEILNLLLKRIENLELRVKSVEMNFTSFR